jgi:hypothetical protein
LQGEVKAAPAPNKLLSGTGRRDRQFVFSADPSDFLITMRTTLLFASRFASETACGEIAIFRQRSVISDSMLYYRSVTASS